MSISLSFSRDGKEAVMYTARSVGSLFVIYGSILFGIHLIHTTYNSYDPLYPWYWSFNRETAAGSIVCFFVAWFTWGEDELCFIDKKKDRIKLVKRIPLKGDTEMVLPDLLELDHIAVEDAPGKETYKRLVFHFDDGKEIPLTEAYFNTSWSIFSRNKAGIYDSKKQLDEWLELEEDDEDEYYGVPEAKGEKEKKMD
jgi:hypothetical protein